MRISHADVLANSEHRDNAAGRSPISNKLRIDLDRITTRARQDASLRDPELLLALFAFQLSGKSGYTSVFGLRKDELANVPTTEMAGCTLDERLTKPTPPAKFGSDMGRVFRAYKAKGSDFIMEEILRHLASQLRAEAELAEVIDKLAEVIDKNANTNARDNFAPTVENFFGRVGGPYLIQLWRTLLDLDEDHTTVTTFAKLKKSEKAEKLAALFGDAETRASHNLTDAQATRIDDWLPDSMV